MQLEIITPETAIFKGEVTAVQFPGKDGSFQVLKGHTPIISTLKEGEVKVDLANSFDEEENGNDFIKMDSANNNVIRVAVKGGTIEMMNDKIIVLAD